MTRDSSHDRSEALNQFVREALAGIDKPLSSPGGSSLLRSRVEQAMNLIVRRCTSSLCGAAARMVEGDDEQRDAVQEVLIVFTKKILETEFRRTMQAERPYSYLIASVRNKAADIRKSRHRSMMQRRELARVAKSLASTHEIETEERRLLLRQLEMLTEADRELLLGRYVDRSTSALIGKQMGLSSHAIRQRLHRLLERLRKEHLGCSDANPPPRGPRAARKRKRRGRMQ
jgi:RNA polymerase sigma factor (sigma-70 family)